MFPAQHFGFLESLFGGGSNYHKVLATGAMAMSRDGKTSAKYTDTAKVEIRRVDNTIHTISVDPDTVSIAVAPDRLFIGVANRPTTYEFKVYFFNGSSWVLEYSVSPQIDNPYPDSFGRAMAVDEQGVRFSCQDNSASTNRGRIWIYVRNTSNNTWSLEYTYTGPTADYCYGSSLAFNSAGNKLFTTNYSVSVGAAVNALHVLTRTGAWNVPSKLCDL